MAAKIMGRNGVRPSNDLHKSHQYRVGAYCHRPLENTSVGT
jgi:hypothetical protein